MPVGGCPDHEHIDVGILQEPPKVGLDCRSATLPVGDSGGSAVEQALVHVANGLDTDVRHLGESVEQLAPAPAKTHHSNRDALVHARSTEKRGHYRARSDLQEISSRAHGDGPT